MREEGLFARIGISAYVSDDPVGLARRFKPDLIQAPASLLDQRLLTDGSLARVRDMGIAVHLRSIFLNGLLFLPPDRVPSQIRGAAAARLSRARRLIAEGRSDPLQAALGFALSRPGSQRGDRRRGDRSRARGGAQGGGEPSAGSRLGRHGPGRSAGPRPAALGGGLNFRRSSPAACC